MNIFLWFLSTPFITARKSSQHLTYSWGFDSQPGRVSRYKCVCGRLWNFQLDWRQVIPLAFYHFFMSDLQIHTWSQKRTSFFSVSNCTGFVFQASWEILVVRLNSLMLQ